MQGIENSVLAFLAAVGIAALVWQGEVPATLVLPVCGGGEALEGWVRALHEMRPQLGRTAEIFIVDCGLSTEGMRRAELLTRRFPKVTVLEREELEQIIE